MRATRLLLCFALFSAACGGPAEESPAPPDESASEPPAAPPAKPGQAPAPEPKQDPGSLSVINAKTKGGDQAAIGIQAPEGWRVMRAPTEPDPHGGSFTLAEATKGLDKTGTLAIHLDTSMGSIYCDLFEKSAPSTVANFVGLARGKRKFWDSEKLAWTARPYYDGTQIHRVMPGFMMQGGDVTGTGYGGIGYTIPDEIEPGERADRPGLMFMASRGAGTAEAQFFITTRPAPHIDGKFTKLGECSPVRLIDQISRVPNSGKPMLRPTTPIVVRSLEVRRLPGGRMKWLPKGTDLSVPAQVPMGRAVEVPAKGAAPLSTPP